MGFTLSSAVAVNTPAIRVTGDHRNIVIQNGTISGNTTVEVANGQWQVTPAGFNVGISVISLKTSNSRFSNLQIFGCRTFGLDAGTSTIVTDVVATSNGQTGINAPTCVITNCITELNGGSGFFAVSGSITNSRATNNAGDGFNANGSVVTNSVARLNGGDGILATNGVVAFCKAGGNGILGGDDIDAANATRTGNSPTP